MTEITIRPTTQFFETGGIVVRAWEGKTPAGERVDVLVAGVRSDAKLADLTPIPSPETDWSPGVGEVMGQLWLLAGQLCADEARALLVVSELMVMTNMTAENRVDAAKRFTVAIETCIALLREKAH
jgi:hypothetical protein